MVKVSLPWVMSLGKIKTTVSIAMETSKIPVFVKHSPGIEGDGESSTDR